MAETPTIAELIARREELMHDPQVLLAKKEWDVRWKLNNDIEELEKLKARGRQLEGSPDGELITGWVDI